MDAKEFKQVLKDLGKRDVTDEQVKGLLAEVDKNGDSVINWNEFLEVGCSLCFNACCRCLSNLRYRTRTFSPRCSQLKLGK
jgi:hypothetical protein